MTSKELIFIRFTFAIFIIIIIHSPTELCYFLVALVPIIAGLKYASIVYLELVQQVFRFPIVYFHVATLGELMETFAGHVYLVDEVIADLLNKAIYVAYQVKLKCQSPSRIAWTGVSVKVKSFYLAINNSIVVINVVFYESGSQVVFPR